jgi:alkanesulfonate monooxygenase SsuD/methylene tetrahydromethanopterin reductase-like flavin-dependent oxidoreductase (luciferase family)
VSGARTRFTLSLPNRGVLLGLLTVPQLLDAAEAAEASGLCDTVAIGDNLLEKPRVEAVALLGALAARTHRVRLNVGCLSSFILRDPILFAIQWASLDVISSGRMEVSVCIGGGDERELRPYGIRRIERVPRLLETLDVVRRLWREDHVTVAGRFHRFEDVTVLPKPVQTRPPVYLANAPDPDGPPALVDRMLLRVLRHADGWHPTGLMPEQFRRLRIRLEALAAAEGRDLSNFSVGCGSLVNIQPDEARARREAEDYVRRYWPHTYGPHSFDRLIAGPPRDVAAGILRYWDAGCRRISVRIGGANYEAQMPLLLREVLPAVWEAVAAREGAPAPRSATADPAPARNPRPRTSAKEPRRRAPGSG